MSVAYLINTTPKYFYLLELHIALIRRYAPGIKWDIYLATEVPGHPICKKLAAAGILLLPLDMSDSGFLKSRAAALALLPDSVRYVLPMQEDFLLERMPDLSAIQESLQIFSADPTVLSIRWMPCPGPAAMRKYNGSDSWYLLDPALDEYLFCFQATLWRKEAVLEWYEKLCNQFLVDYPWTLSDEERRLAEIRANYAENRKGQYYFKKWMMGEDKKHLAWKRKFSAPNGVYMSPWPYRPTAVIGGQLQPFAKELAEREGFTFTVQ